MSDQDNADDHAVSSETGDLEGLAIGLARMSRDLLAQESVQSTLDRIVLHAVELVEGCDAAGVLLLHNDGSVETAAATSETVRLSDQAQGELREGPCFDAAFHRERFYRIADLGTTTPQWPNYAPRARELGVGSMMGFLLYTDEGDLGALDLYASTPNTFTQSSELAGWLLASHAAVAFAGARTTAQMQSAIATRQEIGAALGIIMERHKLTEDEAFQLLKKISQDRNVKLRDLAVTINSGRSA